MSDEKRTFLISDAPAAEDKFGSHERIASALIKLIEFEDGGKTIGIEGEWGSGKSTIINFIQNHFINRDDTKLVIFDTWSHEGDPLRRTVLETLINKIDEYGWLKDKTKKKWAGKRLELARRKKVTEKSNTPVLTKQGKWFTLALMTVPIGMGLFMAGLQGMLSSGVGKITWTQLYLLWACLILGGLLALSPIINLIFTTFSKKTVSA
jgi:hypothetical protein